MVDYNLLKVRAKCYSVSAFDFVSGQELSQVFWKTGYIAPILVTKSLDLDVNFHCTCFKLFTEEIGRTTNIGLGQQSGIPRPYDFIEDTICRFTGYKDIHDIDIYEGDILRLETVKEYFQVSERNLIKSKYGIGILNKNLLESEKVEIVGNIFDNKELLGE